MNKELTIVFISYQSQHLLNRILKQLHKKFKIIIIENSLDINIKKKLEKNYKGVKVIIPESNLGLAKSYKLGIDKSKTKFVFLNNPDIEITNKSIENLLTCAKKIRKFGIISPIYKNEKIFKKFGIQEVDWVDNNFLIKNNKINRNLFDENYFLYFETVDFATNLKKLGRKIYVAKKIKFHHFGSSSLSNKYTNLVRKTRSFHYNWGKFYYYKKNYNYFYGIKKIYPNFIKSIKKSIIFFLTLDFNNLKLSLLEILGILTAVSGLGSFYRPKN